MTTSHEQEQEQERAEEEKEEETITASNKKRRDSAYRCLFPATRATHKPRESRRIKENQGEEKSGLEILVLSEGWRWICLQISMLRDRFCWMAAWRQPWSNTAWFSIKCVDDNNNLTKPHSFGLN